MKLINTLRSLIQILTHEPEPGAFPFQREEALHLDELTDSGLALREAIPVRSAEYWMERGCPELALEELDTLPALARRHPWPRRLHHEATLAAAN